MKFSNNFRLFIPGDRDDRGRPFSLSSPMDAPPFAIRPYAADDRKLALFMISKANFQALAVANNKSTSPSVHCAPHVC